MREVVGLHGCQIISSSGCVHTDLKKPRVSSMASGGATMAAGTLVMFSILLVQHGGTDYQRSPNHERTPMMAALHRLPEELAYGSAEGN